MPAAKKKKTKKIKEVPAKPPIDDGNYTVIMSTDEMFSLVQILSFSRDIFARMADNCARDGDEKAAQVYDARSKLSVLLYQKFKAVAGIGEPTSREVH